jgi:hypothetical protein
MQLDDPVVWWFKAFAYAAFASFGGVMGHLLRTIDKSEKINWGRAALEGCSAGFVGLLVLFACQAMNLSEHWTGVIVGVGGWLGASTTIKMLESLVRKRLGIEGDQSNEHS